MGAISKILVAVDFSDHSRSALDYAAEIARRAGAAIDVLHVWEIPVFEPPELVSAGPTASTWSLPRQNAELALAEFVAGARQRGIALHSAHTRAGVPAITIADAARAGAYDLIVVGRKGRTRLCRTLIGSVAERVIRHASCPVLCVPGPIEGSSSTQDSPRSA
jgi:nucleotide-binding universal stress UspA family protein